MARAGTLMPQASGALQGGNDMINVNGVNNQWNTDRNGHVPFMGYQQPDYMNYQQPEFINYPGQSQTMVQKPAGLNSQDDVMMD